MPDEPFFLEFAKDSTKSIVSKAIEIAAKRTREFYYYVSEQDLLNSSHISEFKKQKITKICVKLPLKLGTGQKASWETIRYQSPLLRSKTAERFVELTKNLQPHFKLFPEIQLNETGLDALYPTLLYFAEQGIPWININPGSLDFNRFGQKVKEALQLLRLHQHSKLHIYFVPFGAKADAWNLKTQNIHSGPTFVDIDLANTCTHNCSFCGLYSEEAIRTYKNGAKSLPPSIVKFLGSRLNRERALEFIQSLPNIVQLVQFGGLGDPGTHPHINEMIKAVRTRGFYLHILSNFSYWNKNTIDELHELSGQPKSLHFYVNLSAATPESYVKIRPNQTADTFEHVLSSIRYARKLAQRDKPKGITFTLQSVTTRYNFREMIDLVRLGKELDVTDVYIKPVEIHSKMHLAQLPQKDERLEYLDYIKRALKTADLLKVDLVNRSSLEHLVQNNA